MTLTTRLFSQDIEITTNGDTLTVRATNITNDPFQFGDDPLKYLEKLNPKKSIQTFNNRHVDNKVDTAFTLTLGNDNFTVYKWDNEENGLLTADVTTNRFKTKHGLQIGMKKSEVIVKLSNYGLKSIPGQLILEDMIVYELLILKFNADKLTKIEFQGYID